MLEQLDSTFPILTCLLFFPLVGAAVLWLFDDEDMVRTSALTIALVELALAIFVLMRFVPGSPAMQFVEHVPWIPALGISYHLAVDGISVLFVGLTAFLTVLVVIYSWDTIRYQTKLYMMALLALETTTMGVFISMDLILFFVFWELMLIPSYFLIKLWGGGAERHYAALKYVLYTLLGSVFMLVGIALLDINYHDYASLHHMDQPYSFDLLELLAVPVPLHQQMLIFWLMFMGFAFKAPVFPFHTWLPDALLEGPIGMAVVLAGIKLGTFGFMRFSIPLLPEASKSATVVSVMMGLGLAAIVYGAIMALIQPDFRRLLAYSSISHLGFIVIGLFALNYQGLQGSLLTMINLGLQHRRTVLHRGLPPEQAADHGADGIRRNGQTHAVARGVFPVDRIGLHRSARHERVRRRVFDPLGRVQSALGLWSHCRHGRHLRCGVFSLVLRTRHAGTGGQGRPGIDRGPASPRNRHRALLVDHDPLDRAVSRSVPAHDERIGAGSGRPDRSWKGRRSQRAGTRDERQAPGGP